MKFLIIKHCAPSSFFPIVCQILSLAPCCQASQYILCQISFTSIKTTRKIVYGLFYSSYFWTGNKLRIAVLQESLAILRTTLVK